jgi:hypothetical protein
MDSKLLLVKVITLLYRESELENNSNNSADLARSVIASIKLPESVMDTDNGREVLVGLRATALWMTDNPVNHKYDRSVLLQRIRVNTGEHESLYSAIESGTEPLEDEGSIKRLILEYKNSLNSYLKHGKVEEIIKNASNKVMFHKEAIDWNHFLKDFVDELEPFMSEGNVESHPAIVGQVDFDDEEAILKMLNSAQEEIASDGVIRMGWQGLNRMTGEHGGIRRGEFVCVGALQHNYKTGFTLNMFKHACIYNKPYMRDSTKKPLNIHISAENDLNFNIMQLYVSLKENETREPVDVKTVDVNEAAKYVRDQLQATGYHIRMLRVDPSDFGFRDLFDLTTKYESEGYEIHCMVFDYLNMLTKRGCQEGPAGFAVRDLFRRVRNFCSPRGIAFITPAQLSSEAKQLVRMNVDDFVKEIANKGYYADCRQIDQEIDLELYIHIVKANGGSYLTMQRGKHRKVGVSPDKDLYCVLKFNPVGGILDDVLGEDLSVSKVGAQTNSPDEDTWWG